MRNLTVYDAADVHQYLDMAGCIDAVRKAMAAQSANELEQPLRTILPMGPGKLFALMPGELPTPAGFGAKLVTAFPDAGKPGRAAHRGLVLLFDRETGNIECVADAREITEIRTAAASAVATDALARPEAKRLVIFGSGAQAHSHLLALTSVRNFDDIVVWGRSEAGASAFAEAAAAATGRPVRVELDGEKAARGADVICTVTGSPTPILRGEWVQPGTHVNVVGSSHAGPVEIDNELVLKSRFIADIRRSVLAAGAEFLVAKEAGLIDDTHIVAEIGEILLGRVVGRTSAEDITLYKSLGHVVQDLAAIGYLHDRARSEAQAA